VIVYFGKLEPGSVSLNGTETKVTCWLSRTEVSVGGMDEGVGGGTGVEVGLKTVKDALHARVIRNTTLLNETNDILREHFSIKTPLYFDKPVNQYNGNRGFFVSLFVDQEFQYFQRFLFSTIPVFSAGTHTRGTSIRAGTFADEFEGACH